MLRECWAVLLYNLDHKPPSLHDRQMPNPLPLLWMFAHRLLTRASSPALRVEGKKGVSAIKAVVVVVVVGGCHQYGLGVVTVFVIWRYVEPHASNPETRAPGTAALQAPGAVANNLTTTDDGTAGVRVLLMRSFLTESETSAFGVTTQEQQETSCSSGEKV